LERSDKIEGNKKQLARLARRAALIQALKDATTFMTLKRFGAKRQD
jgi:hypothetical protein